MKTAPAKIKTPPTEIKTTQSQAETAQTQVKTTQVKTTQVKTRQAEACPTGANHGRSASGCSTSSTKTFRLSLVVTRKKFTRVPFAPARVDG